MDGLSRDDVVAIRPLEEILATLDDKGALDGLPFMPEMARYCGGRYRVFRRAARTCVEGIGERTMHDAVFLTGLRCDGSSHDGCQRGCLFFWKQEWLQPAETTAPPPRQAAQQAAALADRLPVRFEDRYYCQSTELVRATGATPDAALREIGTLFDDLRHGEITPWHLARILARVAINKVRKALGVRPIGRFTGQAAGKPVERVGLRPGDMVEIRPRSEIEATLDPFGKNRGLLFDPEMASFKGRFEVDQVLDRIILETNGKMRNLAGTVTLKGVACTGLCTRNCPRANPLYWRESWLKRIPRTAEAEVPESVDRHPIPIRAGR